MRVLLVCEGFNNSSINVQPWKHVFEIGKGLQRKGHQAFVLTDANALSCEEENIGNIPVRSIRKGRFLFDSDELTSSLADDFDVINWNASGVLSSLNFLRLKNLGRNLVWTLHAGTIGWSDLRNLRITDVPSLGLFWNNILYSMTSRMLIKKSSQFPDLRAIVTLSKRLKEHLVSSGVKEEKVRVIYSGVDEAFVPKGQEYVKRAREEMGFKPDEAIVLYYGPLNPFRGADELVDSVPMVLSKFKNAVFIFLGRTGQADHKSMSLKKHLMATERVRLVEGFLDQESILKYLNVADIVVLPFRFWPFIECPLTVLETMAVGKPVITTKVGAIPEVVQNGITGLIVDPRSREIGAAIAKLLANRDLGFELGSNACDYVRKFHSWNYIVDQTIEVFQESRN